MEDEAFINTLCGNHISYTSILNWLRSFDYDIRISEQSCILVSGQPCIGKTYSIKNICKHLNADLTSIDNHRCHNACQLKDMIFKTATSSLMQILTNTSGKKIIILDNFDSMFVADKTISTTLLKLLTEKKLKNIPIICITNCDILKKMGDIKKLCKTYELSTPSKHDIITLLNGYNIPITRIKKLYDDCQANLQHIFQNLNDLSSNTTTNRDEHYELINLYDTTFNRDKSRRLIDSDVWLIPLRFHENLIQELGNRSTQISKKHAVYKDFIEILCIYDYFMCKNNIECGIEIFIAAVYLISMVQHKKRQASNMDNFTKILSYLSLQKKYVKASFNSSFPLYQISNYHISLTNRKFICFN